ncbi:HNH endonuclease, partial [Acinetobacter sp. IRS14]|uniref:HNH endonuclease n=1 Tax=Acinetobacter sp. IRS14 TaxID=2983398 RepID=UPI002AFE57CC
ADAVGAVTPGATGLGWGVRAAATTKTAANLARAQQRAEKLNKVDRSGKEFTKAGKEVVKDLNKIENNGKLVCASCKETLVQPKQSQKGITPPKNEAHVDHKVPKSLGGSGTPNNGQILCRSCNISKSNK